MLIKAISALTMSGFMVGSLFMAARLRYRKQKPAGTAALPTTTLPLSVALQHTDWKIRLNAIQSLHDSRAESVLPDLIQALNDTDPDVREAAARAAAQFGGAAVPGLADILKTGTLDARTLAAKTLGSIGDKAAVPALIAALHDHSVWVRLPAVETPGSMGDKSAVEALAHALAHDKDQSVRAAVRHALEYIGTPEALAALKPPADA